MTACSIKKEIRTENPEIFRRKILDWYDAHRRVLPWRAQKSEDANPYHVWLSEIMLQQTTVTAVIPYFLKFTQRWPNIHSLAHADIDDVMQYWAGLGYYARARNLHKCANQIVEQYAGAFPTEKTELLKLAGIGDYTSSAITSIAFNKPANVVDGNVERVMARYHACEEALPKGKKTLKSLAHIYTDGFLNRPGDYAQALMDIGATICTPKSPKCMLCPVQNSCKGFEQGNPTHYPIKANMKQKAVRYGFVYWVENNFNQVQVIKRPPQGLLGGMPALPTTEWLEEETKLSHLYENDIENIGSVEHVFTHFHLKLRVFRVKSNIISNGEWHDISNLEKSIFPTVFKKVVTLFK